MAEYKMDSSLLAEQHNTLVMVDEIIGRAHLAMKPSFEILGGTALLLHGIEAVFTVDIDCANAQSETVKQLVEPFISDMASTVAVLPRNYKSRLKEYNFGEFNNIEVYLISIPDIVISKLGAWRFKDREDLSKTGVLARCDMGQIISIINDEFDSDMSALLTTRLVSL